MKYTRAGRLEALRRTVPAIALSVASLGAPAVLAAQDVPPDPTVEQLDARAQARQVLPPDVFAQVDAEAVELEASGIDPDVLYRKALEGAAKRVPAARLVPGVTQYAGRLRAARTALGGDAPSAAPIATPLIVAGADALQRGVAAEVLGRLGEDGAQRTPVSVLVLADLVETGIGDERALSLVREAMQARTRDQRMLEIPAEVQRLLRQGRSPTDVADEMRRALRRRGGGAPTRMPGG